MKENKEWTEHQILRCLKVAKEGCSFTYRRNFASDVLELIEALKAENAELRAKVEETPNLEFQIGDIAYVVEFAFSDGYNEQDEMTHDVKFYVCQKRLNTESERLYACGDYLEQKAFKSKKAAEEAAEARLKELEANE